MTTILACGHSTSETVTKIPHQPKLGAYCIACRAWTEVMPRWEGKNDRTRSQEYAYKEQTQTRTGCPNCGSKATVYEGDRERCADCGRG